jgi:hypothetical protein
LGRISRKPARQHVKSTQIEKVTGARQPHRRLSRKKAQGATTCMYLHVPAYFGVKTGGFASNMRPVLRSACRLTQMAGWKLNRTSFPGTPCTAVTPSQVFIINNLQKFNPSHVTAQPVTTANPNQKSPRIGAFDGGISLRPP